MKYIFVILIFLGSPFAFADPSDSIVVLPDSWGIFEFIHFRTDATKQKDAVAIIEQLILDNVSAVDGVTSAIVNAKQPEAQVQGMGLDEFKEKFDMANKELKLLYPNGTGPYPAPGDDYRLAIQNILAQKDELSKKYEAIGFPIDGVIDQYYEEGNPKATMVIDSVEQRYKAQNEELERLHAVEKQLGHIGTQYGNIAKELMAH